MLAAYFSTKKELSMAKFKIHMKKDSALSADAAGEHVGRVASSEKDVVVYSTSMSEAIVQATRSNQDFYAASWECIEADAKTEAQLAEEAKDKKILEDWKKKKDDASSKKD